jgi:competence protein ComFC
MADVIPDLQQSIHAFGVRLAVAFGRLLYPPHCAVCGRAVREHEDRYLCSDCVGRINFVFDPTCRKCGHELGPYPKNAARCINCRNVPLRFDRAVAAAHHAGAVRDLILALKFGRQKQNAFPLATFLAARLGETDIPEQAQLIVPVPLHRSRRRSRGFNQSELLAKELGRELSLMVSARVLKRVLDTPPQSRGLSLAGRRANVKGAFAARSPRAIAGKCVLLIDDVLTTGATTSECAGELKRAGAKKVYVATVTRRMKTPPAAGDDEPADPSGDER